MEKWDKEKGGYPYGKKKFPAGLEEEVLREIEFGLSSPEFAEVKPPPEELKPIVELPPAEEFREELPELPERYNKDMLVIMVRDPFWSFAYWEVTDETIKQAKEALGEEVFNKSKLVIRFYIILPELTSLPKPVYEVEVRGFIGSWYINYATYEGTLYGELGLVTPRGDFYKLVASRPLSFPIPTIAPPPEEGEPVKWMKVTEETTEVREVPTETKEYKEELYKVYPLEEVVVSTFILTEVPEEFYRYLKEKLKEQEGASIFPIP